METRAPDDVIVVGRIARAHGLRGQVVVQPATPDSQILLQVRSVLIDRGGSRRTLDVRDARMQGRALLLAFEGFPDRTAAEALVGTELRLPRRDLPAPSEGEHYADALMDAVVEAPSGQPLGRVVDIESAGTHDWLVVENEKGRHLVPLTEPLVRIDAERHRIVVDAPEGLLDGALEE